MTLSVRQKLYLLFGFQLISFVGLFCFFYFYIIPAVKGLETEKHRATQIIKKISGLQLVINSYFKGNVGSNRVKEEIQDVSQLLSSTDIKNRLKDIYTRIEYIDKLNKQNNALHDRLFNILDKSIKASNDYINQISYRLESKKQRRKVSDLERMVLRLAVVNTQTNNDIKRLFLSLYSDINNVSKLYKLLDNAVKNAGEAKNMLKGSSLVSLPENALKLDMEAEKIAKAFETNIRKKEELEENIRKTLNAIILNVSSETATIISKIKRYINVVNLFIILMAVIAAILIYTILRSMNFVIFELQSKLPKIAQGDLNQRLAVYNKDEFGQICKLFNNFLMRLRDNLKNILNKQNEFISSSEKLAIFTDDVTNTNIEMIKEMKVISEDSSKIKSEAEKSVVSIEHLRDNIDQVNAKAFDMKHEIVNVSQTVKDTDAVMERLNSSVQEIGQILKMINDITEQINLLSLNATIEAARAGESGKGFAVVANEIKELASETSKATEYIKEKITAIQQSSKETSDTISQINSLVEAFIDSFDAITQISEEQKNSAQDTYASIENTARHLSRIDNNISALHKKTKNIEENIKNTKEAIVQINTMIKSTKQMISQFKL